MNRKKVIDMGLDSCNHLGRMTRMAEIPSRRFNYESIKCHWCGNALSDPMIFNGMQQLKCYPSITIHNQCIGHVEAAIVEAVGYSLAAPFLRILGRNPDSTYHYLEYLNPK